MLLELFVVAIILSAIALGTAIIKFVGSDILLISIGGVATVAYGPWLEYALDSTSKSTRRFAIATAYFACALALAVLLPLVALLSFIIFRLFWPY